MRETRYKIATQQLKEGRRMPFGKKSQSQVLTLLKIEKERTIHLLYLRCPHPTWQ